jgi:hypothetical protein
MALFVYNSQLVVVLSGVEGLIILRLVQRTSHIFYLIYHPFSVMLADPVF